MNRSLIATVVLIPALLAGQSALAQNSAFERQAASLQVRFNENDLNDSVRAREVYYKLTVAAHRVCDSEVYDPLTAIEDRECVASAVSEAVRQLNRPALSLLDGQAPNIGQRTEVALNN